MTATSKWITELFKATQEKYRSVDSFFVFQHSLTAVSDLVYNSVDEIFNMTPYHSLDHPSIGSSLLFKLNSDGEGLVHGYLSMDQDLDPRILKTNQPLQRVQFPVAEYLFITHKGPFSDINVTYKTIEEILEKEQLKAIIHPLLVFPRGLPTSIYDSTIIEIWTATDSDFNAEERRSESLQEAIPKKTFNFYQS